MKFLYLILLSAVNCFPQEDSSKVVTQNPSPMIENSRLHQRIDTKEFEGLTYTIDNFFNKPVIAYKGSGTDTDKPVDLVIHFHGNADIVKYAVEQQEANIIATVVNLGAGSKIYFESFKKPKIFGKLLDTLLNKYYYLTGKKIEINRIHLTGFSAGYGAIKAILMDTEYFEQVSSVILLDGLHTSYIPDRKVLFEGGEIDSNALEIFLKLAEYTSKSEKPIKKLLITHSEIFPGTFVSTTETSDYLISKLELKRQPVLKWGPLGMQQLSEVKKNNFVILGYAGNTAPDHIDHLHALFYFLKKILNNNIYH